ncbi:MAG: hypothetical protein GX254_09155 [Clostridiales bacterium]|nr:hypothetical protein [Clostridiales bacterium]
MLRIVGALMVISCCSIIGMGYAGGLRARKKNLAGFIAALTVMRSEICDLLTPMPELLERMAGQTEPPIKQFFINCLSFMKMQMPFSKAWEKAVRETAGLELYTEEIFCLCRLGMLLGRYEVEEQRVAITRTIVRLEEFHRRAGEDMAGRGKVCAAMGISAGLMIAIIMI